MSKKNAEHQAAHRKRKAESGMKRFDQWMSSAKHELATAIDKLSDCNVKKVMDFIKSLTK